MTSHEGEDSSAVSGRGWAYTGMLVGALVSTAANLAHSYIPPAIAPAWWPSGKPWDRTQWHPQLGAVIGAVFWPIALFLASELLVRIAWPEGRRWVVLRFGGLLPVAAVAAIVSYKHLSALIGYYGEDYLTAHIGPLAVDGLMVMATGALVATSGHRRGSEADNAADILSAVPDTLHPLLTDTGTASTSETSDTAPDRAADSEPDTESRDTDTGPDIGSDSLTDMQPDADTSKRVPAPRAVSAADTAAKVERLLKKHPDMSAVDIAKRIGVTDRTVRRHLADRRQTAELVAGAPGNRSPDAGLGVNGHTFESDTPR